MFLYTTLYLQQILGLSAIEAGLVYLPGTLVMLFVSGATAQLGAKVPARTMIARGLALVAVGMGLFTLAGIELLVGVLTLPGLLVACIGTGLFNPARDERRADLGPAGAERRRRGRERHVPPGRHRGRRRRPRRADPGRGRVRRRDARQSYVDGMHDALLGRRPASPLSARSPAGC